MRANGRVQSLTLEWVIAVNADLFQSYANFIDGPRSEAINLNISYNNIHAHFQLLQHFCVVRQNNNERKKKKTTALMDFCFGLFITKSNYLAAINHLIQFTPLHMLFQSVKRFA